MSSSPVLAAFNKPIFGVAFLLLCIVCTPPATAEETDLSGGLFRTRVWVRTDGPEISSSDWQTRSTPAFNQPRPSTDPSSLPKDPRSARKPAPDFPGLKIVGTVVGRDQGHWLVVEEATEFVHRIPEDRIARLDVGTRKSNVVPGLIIGGLVGAVAGWHLAKVESSNDGSDFLVAAVSPAVQLTGGFVGLLFGTAVGGVTGSLIEMDSWQEIQLSRGASVLTSVSGTNGNEAAVAFQFKLR